LILMYGEITIFEAVNNVVNKIQYVI
jgi:hypothetical protein